MNSTQAPRRANAVNVLGVALIAMWLEQIVHEATHGLVALLVGGDWLRWWYWATETRAATDEAFWPVLAIKASAALVNLAMAAVGVAWLRARRRADRRPLLQLFVMYFTAWSLFAGAGYLMVDPIFAGPDSVGDWAKVVMMLGGSWAVRLPIIAVGGGLVVWGFYWLGGTARRFTFAPEATPTRAEQVRAGLLLCVAPYVVGNVVATALAAFHPLGTGGLVLVAMKVWMGFSGFFWAWFIKFHHGEALADDARVRLPRRASPGVLVGLVVTAVVVAVLLAGVP